MFPFTNVHLSIRTYCHIVSIFWAFNNCAVMCLVAQSYLTLCEPIDYSLPGSSDHGDSPGKNTGVDWHALFQGIFPTQELNQGFLHCRQILYQLSYQGSPIQWLSYSNSLQQTVLQSKSLINTSSFFFFIIGEIGVTMYWIIQVFASVIFSPLVILYWVLWKWLDILYLNSYYLFIVNIEPQAVTLV